MSVRPPAFQRIFEVLGVAAFLVLAAFDAWRLGAAGLHPVLLLVAAALAWAAIDLISGLVHWTFDTWGSVESRGLGRTVIRSFREHHDDPRSICRHDFVETNGASAIAALPALTAAALLPLESAALAFAQALLFFASLGALLANQCHKWAHARPEEVSAAVRLAQRCGLLLSPAHHRHHHGRPHVSHYCTVNGWLNRALDGAGFFRACERVIQAVSGAEPRRSA